MHKPENNKFTKSLNQFYLNCQSFRQVEPSSFIYHSRIHRQTQIKALKFKLYQRKQKSLVSFQKLSQVLDANDKVFKSSIGFSNPQSFFKIKVKNKQKFKDSFFSQKQKCTHLTKLLKSHFNKGEFERKKNQEFNNRYGHEQKSNEKHQEKYDSTKRHSEKYNSANKRQNMNNKIQEYNFLKSRQLQSSRNHQVQQAQNKQQNVGQSISQRVKSMGKRVHRFSNYCNFQVK